MIHRPHCEQFSLELFDEEIVPMKAVDCVLHIIQSNMDVAVDFFM